jgi:hypothetical protein
MNRTRTLSAAERFEVCLAALLLASETGREDLIPSLKAAALSAARQMNGPSQTPRQRAARAAARGSIRRVVSPDGRYV